MAGAGRKEPRLYVASAEEIAEGKVTDVYFERAAEILREKGLGDVKVRLEVHAYSFPKGYQWAVFAGLEEALAIMRGKPFTVYALPEGTLFKTVEPVMVIEASYADFAAYETAVLGVLRFATSIATKAARIKKLAGEKRVFFFGLRALHPAVAPAADRAAYIGGCDGVAGSVSAEKLGLKPVGTMPHAYIIAFGDPVEAWKAFDEVMPPEVPRIALADTFFDERFESLLAAKVLGENLHGVRLDTPKSRRGSMRTIVEEVRWTLAIHGYSDVKIYVSGGIDEEQVAELRDLVDGFGVGTSIAAAPNIDLSMDVVEVKRDGKWTPVSKRGKLPGAKQLYRKRPGLNDLILPWGSTPPEGYKPMLVKVMEDGELTVDLPSLDEIRSYVLEQLSEVDL